MPNHVGAVVTGSHGGGFYALVQLAVVGAALYGGIWCFLKIYDAVMERVDDYRARRR
ncbi:MAG: hypothetical protein AAB320_02160 [Elusimicrobiota bacterium]